jgi:hypothetical protein
MRTDAKLKEICDQLSQAHGDLHTTARRCGVSPQFIMQWIKDDTEAAKQIEEAQRVGYMGLESAAIQRAVHGVEEDVFYKGEVCGTKTNYSDTLLSKLLEARVPAFKKGEQSTNTFNGPTQINIMPRAETYDQWLEMKKTTLDDRAKQKALAAPAAQVPEILQGDYVELTPEASDKPLAALKGLL